MNAEHLAKEADRLKNDPIFTEALSAIRTDALEAIAVANADDKTMILRLQQKVAVIDEIHAVLERFVIGAGQSLDDASPYA